MGGLALSPFEFILILIAIVAGFAISEILRAWGVLIRDRVRFRSAALYCYASLLLLVLILRYTWVLWDLRAMEWQFFSFVLAFAPMLVLGLAAFVISIARGPTPNIAEHYFVQARPLYILLVVFLSFWSLADLLTMEHGDGGDGLPYAIPVRSALTVLALGLAFTKKEALHWMLLTVWFAFTIGASLVAVPQL